MDFDKNGANQNRDEAIDRVDAVADQAWKDAALQVIYETCVRNAFFFADDLWASFIAKWGDFATQGTHELRAMGPVMRRAVGAKWCECTGQYRRVSRNHRHLRPVWKSLIYGTDAALNKTAAPANPGCSPAARVEEPCT
jgi:hypothetical protein